MVKKNLGSIASSLKPAAEKLPTLFVPDPSPTASETPKESESTRQFSFDLGKSQRKELARLEADADMTMRAFILNGLKKEGLTVNDEDLMDQRRS